MCGVKKCQCSLSVKREKEKKIVSRKKNADSRSPRRARKSRFAEHTTAFFSLENGIKNEHSAGRSVVVGPRVKSVIRFGEIDGESL